MSNALRAGWFNRRWCRGVPIVGFVPARFYLDTPDDHWMQDPLVYDETDVHVYPLDGIDSVWVVYLTSDGDIRIEGKSI